MQDRAATQSLSGGYNLRPRRDPLLNAIAKTLPYDVLLQFYVMSQMRRRHGYNLRSRSRSTFEKKSANFEFENPSIDTLASLIHSQSDWAATETVMAYLNLTTRVWPIPVARPEANHEKAITITCKQTTFRHRRIECGMFMLLYRGTVPYLCMNTRTVGVHYDSTIHE
eukprot:COSAG02_NODE_18632_length_928_cov_1.141134_1_plen_168_part_00